MEQAVSFTCACGVVNNVTAHRSWRADERETLVALISDDFHWFACAACGKNTNLNIDLMAMSHHDNWIIQVVTQDKDVDAAIARAKQFMPTARSRIVANRYQLREKVSLFFGKVDDVAYQIWMFQKRISLGLQPHEQLQFKSMELGNRIVLDYIDIQKRTRGPEISLPLSELADIALRFQTVRYQNEPFVDPGLARHLMEKVALKKTIMGRGKLADGTAFMTDGSILVREDLVLHEWFQFAPQLRELSTQQLETAIGPASTTFTTLDQLTPSKIYNNTSRTIDQVGIAQPYVELLRSMPGPLRLGTTGQRGQIRVTNPNGTLVAVVMPLALLPESDTHIAPPVPGATRATIATTGDRITAKNHYGTITFAPDVLRGVTPTVGGLIDCDAEAGVASRVWPAGLPRPG
ncbi:MAG: CpXC domain-containing protein [Kofleriaceae bacterium]